MPIEYPEYLITILMNINIDIHQNNSFIGYMVSSGDFDQLHDFRNVMNSFSNYFYGDVIEFSHGNYFIVKSDTRYWVYLL